MRKSKAVGDRVGGEIESAGDEGPIGAIRFGKITSTFITPEQKERLLVQFSSAV